MDSERILDEFCFDSNLIVGGFCSESETFRTVSGWILDGSCMDSGRILGGCCSGSTWILSGFWMDTDRILGGF